MSFPWENIISSSFVCAHNQWFLKLCLFSITDKSQAVPFGRYLHKFYAFPIRGSNLRLLSNRRLLYEWRRPSLTTAAAEDGIMGWWRRWSLLKVQFGVRYCQFPFVWHTQYFCTPSGPMSGKHSSAVAGVMQGSFNNGDSFTRKLKIRNWIVIVTTRPEVSKKRQTPGLQFQ